MACGLRGSSVQEILQARILAIPFSSRSLQPRDQTWVSCIIGEIFHCIVTREAFASSRIRQRGTHMTKTQRPAAMAEQGPEPLLV